PSIAHLKHLGSAFLTKPFPWILAALEASEDLCSSSAKPMNMIAYILAKTDCICCCPPRILTLLSAYLLLCLPGLTQVPDYVPTDDLIGWWPFNGNADDESGNGNDGVVTGAALTNDRHGQVNAAYAFNGVSDFISTPAQGPTGATPRTFSFWVRTESTAHQTPIDHYGGVGGAFQPILNNPCPGLGVDAGTGVVTRGGPGLIDGNWHHCALVFEPTQGSTINSVVMYIDGVVQPSIACTALDPNAVVNNTSSLPVLFGKTTSDVRYLDGDLDDIGIWGRALTPQEVVGMCAGDTTAATPTWLPVECLVAWYPFDGGPFDQSGNGHHGVVNGAVLTTGHSGIPQSAYFFDGEGAKIGIGNAAELGRAATSFSVVAWVRLDQPATERSCIISNRTGSMVVPGSCIGIAGVIDPGPGFDLGEMNISAADPIQYCSDQAMPIGAWTHTALTYDRDAGMVRIYYNGTLVSEGALSNFTENSLSMHTIGFSANENGGIYPLNGAIDDLALYNCVLSEAEIAVIHEGSTTNIHDQRPPLGMVITPNPTCGPVSLEFSLVGMLVVHVFDMTGRVVYNETIQANGAETTHSLDFSHLATGSYTLILRNDTVAASQRLVIE
ncbi:MAG: T9SS type A sorting domain-containing protein, partial [Flavobacteriales bacterium]|nr:T9SS type A sorting domain-containing protein [Flavobacteriales bacterium]